MRHSLGAALFTLCRKLMLYINKVKYGGYER